VEAEVLDLRLSTRAGEGRTDAAPGGAVGLPEHRAAKLAVKVLPLLAVEHSEHVVDGAVHRDLAPPSALRPLELDHAPCEVHALPPEPEDLPETHPRVQGHRDDGLEAAELRRLAARAIG
jgi:hypothetical protein